MQKEDIVTIIYAAIDELNAQLPSNRKISKTLNTVLLGSLDSLALVNLITFTEQRIEDELGRVVTIADEAALSARQSPFGTVDSLSSYISRLLAEGSKASH